jgi:hypothetical protein
MTTVLLWKEYRQQRAIWIAVAVLAVLLVTTVALATGQGSGWEVFQEYHVRPTLNMLLLCLMVAYGVCAGAATLAGEREVGTLPFLDNLISQRGPIWQTKALAAVLFMLLHSVFLSVLGLGLGFASWEMALILPLVGLDALAWGLLGGAVSRSVLEAILIGIVAMACGWAIALFARDAFLLFSLEAAAALGASYASYRVFCREDRLRRPARAVVLKWVPRIPTRPLVLLWLAARQGRWVLAAGFTGAVILGFTVHFYAIAVWPVATLLAGLACGLMVFCPDQNGPARFLASQRFPPGRLWLGKNLFWAAALAAMVVTAWLVAMLQLSATDPALSLSFRESRGEHHWLAIWLGWQHASTLLSPVVFLVLWPIHGFCFGQYFGQLARRPVIAAILAAFMAPLVLALWVPSLLFGGVPAWQLLVVPAMLLVATRLTQWAWLCDRLGSRRAIVTLTTAAILLVVTQAGFLWFRVVQVPDVGQPFDVKAFVASMPTPEKNEAGPLIRKACRQLADVEKEYGESPNILVPDDEKAANEPNAVLELTDIEILTRGWPKRDKEFGLRLDRLFSGAWAQDAQRAAKLPLGMLQDPRLTSRQTQFDFSNQCRTMAVLFALKAVRVQAQGDSKEALAQIETALALSRQVESFAPAIMYWTGCQMEDYAYLAVQRWLEKVGPDKELLRSAVALLRHQESIKPPLVNSIKAEYLVYLNSREAGPRINAVLDKAMTVVSKAPWEKERQRRVGNALFLEQIREVTGRPPEQELIGTQAKQWGELFGHASWAYRFGQLLYLPRFHADNSNQTLRALLLAMAVAQFQAENGSAPETLDVLVPGYLPRLPVEPNTERPFEYRISKGEQIKGDGPDTQPLRIAPGQALIQCSGIRGPIFPVPVWPKK